jgi:hypothetical protein
VRTASAKQVRLEFRADAHAAISGASARTVLGYDPPPAVKRRARTARVAVGRRPACVMQPESAQTRSGGICVSAMRHEGLGPETRYARFLAGVNRLNDRTRSELARVDHRNRQALTAVAALRHGANRRTRVAGIGSAAYRKGTARAIP